MLDSVRQHQKILQSVLLILIFPSFAFFGIQSYQGISSNANDIIKIGDQSINQLELDNAVKNQATRLGSNQAVSQTPGFKNAVLGQLIQQKLLAYDVKDLNLQVTSNQLAKELLLFPEVAALKKPDGSIDSDKYRQLLENNGLTVSQFEAIKRGEIMGNALQNALTGNGQSITSHQVAEKITKALSMEREVQAMFFTANEYLNKIKVEPSEIQDYYQANPVQFQSVPLVDIEYLTLSKKENEDATAFAKKADQFANMVYEQADSLKPAAESFQLQIESQAAISSKGISNLPKTHPLNQTKLLEALFKDEAIRSGKNLEAIEVSPGVLIAARVIKNYPASTLPLEKVKDSIEKAVVQKKAEELAVKEGMATFSNLQKNPTEMISGKAFSKSIWVSRNRPADLTGEPFERVFGVKDTNLPQIVSSNIPGVGLAIYRVNQLREGEKTDPKVAIEQFKQIGQLVNQSELAAYFENIKSRASIKFLKNNF